MAVDAYNKVCVCVCVFCVYWQYKRLFIINDWPLFLLWHRIVSPATAKQSHTLSHRERYKIDHAYSIISMTL